MKYHPHPRTAKVLDWSLQKIQEVPYRVTLRWVFYRCVQELGLTKKDYEVFKKWTSRARKRFWNGWSPETLVDDTRQIHRRGGGYDSSKDWRASFKDAQCVLDKRSSQPQIPIVCFEAEAMFSQFEYYTSPYFVSMVPFKGDYTIQPKWMLAKMIESFRRCYDKPVMVLYFGDLDPKGQEIPENAMKDVRKWCEVPFKFQRVGLNLEHVKRWDLPENLDRPKQYQWEALPDVAAAKLIKDSLRIVDLNAIRKRELEEEEATRSWRDLSEML